MGVLGTAGGADETPALPAFFFMEPVVKASSVMKCIATVLVATVAWALAGCASDNVAWHDANHLNSANPPVGISTPPTSTAVGFEPTAPFYPAQKGSYGVGESSRAFFSVGSGPVPTSQTDELTTPATPAYTSERP